MTNPFISVIIPTWNRAELLSEAIVSVIEQSYRPLEIIVVDDGSIDHTAGVVASFGGRVRYFFQENLGPPAARNTGLRYARGEVIGFLDSDDIWPPGRLNMLIKHLKPDVDIAMGYSQKIDLTIPENEQSASPTDEPRMAMSLSCALIRKTVFNQIGNLDESLIQGDDWDWFMRVREAGVPLMVVPFNVLLVRRHSNNITLNLTENRMFTARVLKKSIDRRNFGKPLDQTPPSLPPFEKAVTHHDQVSVEEKNAK